MVGAYGYGVVTDALDYIRRTVDYKAVVLVLQFLDINSGLRLTGGKKE
jgi:hypothetical protein